VARRIYVIELRPEAGRRRDPRIPWVYVGSSAREPELRFEQHHRGYRSAGIVKRHALRLRPDLYEDLDPIRGSRAAVTAEKQRALELAGAGFVAHCDGVSYGRRGEPGAGPWEEWDAERLAPVAEHLDAAIAELRECSFTPLDPARCAELLHGTRAFWVAEHLDPVDPPPAYGRFAHVRLDVLAGRAEAAIGVAAVR
jgi:hypothetical protein